MVQQLPEPGRGAQTGGRRRGLAFITPPETGEYTFWVAGDDNCQLWLSTDYNPANATMIAQVASWSGVAEWDVKRPDSSRPPCPLWQVRSTTSKA